MTDTPPLYQTSDLELVTFFVLHDIHPIKRTKGDLRATLYYNKTDELDKLLVEYMSECRACRISFSKVCYARSAAKRELLDGNV